MQDRLRLILVDLPIITKRLRGRDIKDQVVLVWLWKQRDWEDETPRIKWSLVSCGKETLPGGKSHSRVLIRAGYTCHKGCYVGLKTEQPVLVPAYMWLSLKPATRNNLLNWREFFLDSCRQMYICANELVQFKNIRA